MMDACAGLCFSAFTKRVYKAYKIWHKEPPGIGDLKRS